MITKRCCVCTTVKSAEEFNAHAKRKDGLQSLCRECQRKRFQGYYQQNKTHVKEATRERSKILKRECRLHVAGFLREHPCVDCGCSDIRVLEFDHLDGLSKKDGVMALVSWGASLKVVKEEMLKCEVRCKNCHAIKTYQRIGGSWHDQFIASWDNGSPPLSESVR